MAMWEISATAVAITLLPTFPIWGLAAVVFAPLLVLAIIKAKIQSRENGQKHSWASFFSDEAPRQRAADRMSFIHRLLRHGIPLGLGWGFMMTQLFAVHPTPIWALGWADMLRALAASALFGTVTTATNYWIDQQSRAKSISRRA